MKAARRLAVRESDHELAHLLSVHVKGLSLDANQVRAHVISPRNIAGVFSDHGPAESTLGFVPRGPIIGVLPEHLDVAAFGDALHAALRDRVAGYSVQLRQHGQSIFSRNWQWAKRPQDGTENWTSDVQLHVASVSKLITAMAMTLLMSDKGVSPDAQIIDYLPDYWAKGPNIQYITFRNLLNHTSGIFRSQDSFDFLTLKSVVASGISLDPNASEHLGKYHYHNLNFGLCRILLTVMNGNLSRSANFTPLFDDLVWDIVTIAAYANFAQARIFRSAGVFNASLDHPDAAGLAYEGPRDPQQGWNSGSLQAVSGAAGWHLSVDQVLDVMSEFRRGRSIVTPEAAQGMLDNGFGVDPFVIPPPGQRIPPGLLTPAGELYCKNGRWYDATPGREEQCLAYFLPQDMELVVLANSEVEDVGGPEQFFRDVVTQVYLANLTSQLTVLA